MCTLTNYINKYLCNIINVLILLIVYKGEMSRGLKKNTELGKTI